MPKRVIAVTNQKGGVGKTTTAINLASMLALAGKKTLLIDIDPQGNATSGVGIKKADIQRNMYHVFLEGTMDDDVVMQSPCAHLDVVASAIDLVSVDVEFANVPEREHVIKQALAMIKDRYHYVIFDCPPSLSLLTLNALTAADSILIPVQCEYFALEGLTQLLDIFDLVKESLNTALAIEGFVFTMVREEERLAQQVIQDVSTHFKDAVFQSRIHYDSVLSEAPGFAMPAVYYDPRSVGAQDYLALAEEILERSY